MFREKGLEKARIIKAADVSMMQDAGDVILRAKNIAVSIEKKAEDDALKIIEKAKQEASLIIENAQNTGKAFVHSMEREERDKATEKAANYLLDLTTNLQEQFASIDDEIIQLVHDAIEKIIGDLDETDKIEKAVAQGLRDLKDQYGLILLVHSSQFDAAQVAVSRFHSFVGHEKGPIHRVEIDADLKPGECFILSSGGLLDVSIKCQLDNIIEGLRNHHQQEALI